MKRELKLKSIAVLAALSIATVLFSQTPIPGYQNGAGDNYDDAGTTYVTVGKTIPLYASPDGYYHPSYDPITGNGITVGFTWNWSITTGGTLVTLGAGTANYNTVQGDAVGTATINVQEVSPYASGCSDAGTDVTINVVAVPAIEFATVDTEDCEDGTFPGSIDVTVSGGYNAYRLAWTLEIKSTNADGSVETWYDDENGTNPTPGASKLAVNYTQAAPEASALAGPGTHDIITVGAFNTIGGESTEYIYSINGINDQASRWGDFLTLAGLGTVNTATAGDYDYYDTGGETITITVHPIPTTGPIFHIDAGVAN